MSPPKTSIEVIAVDDEPPMLRAIQQRVQMAGEHFHVRTSTTGEEALELARKLAPDILVTDIVMPSMDGAKVFQEIQKIAPKVRCIAITAFADRDKPVEFLKHGARDFIDKGPNFGVELLAALRQQAEAVLAERKAEELNRRNRELSEAIRQIVTSVRSYMEMRGGTDVEKIAGSMARSAVLATGAKAAAVLLLDDAATTLVTKGSVGCVGKTAPVPMGKGVAGRVASTGRFQCVMKKGNDPIAPDSPAGSAESGRTSIIAVPLNAHDEVLGVVEVFDLQEMKPQSLELVSELARLGAEAIGGQESQKNPTEFLLSSLKKATDAVETGGPVAREAAKTAFLQIQPVIEKMDLSPEDDRILAMAKMIREVQSFGDSEVAFCKTVLESFLEMLRATRGGTVFS